MLTDSYGDAITEVSPFEGFDWHDISSDTIQRQFEAPYFFSADAFAYYLPAYIWSSQASLDSLELAIENCLAVLSDTPNTEWLAWRQLRWERFNRLQLMLILKWLNC